MTQPELDRTHYLMIQLSDGIDMQQTILAELRVILEEYRTWLEEQMEISIGGEPTREDLKPL